MWQESTADEAPPPLPLFLAALKTGLLTYEEKRTSLLSEQGTGPVPSDAASCFDTHEKCPIWASIVRDSYRLIVHLGSLH